jgi:hypothetical protein
LDQPLQLQEQEQAARLVLLSQLSQEQWQAVKVEKHLVLLEEQ